MTVNATSGVPVTLVALFEDNGTAAEPELPLTLTIVPAAGGDAVLSTEDLANPAVGTYTYEWTPPTVTTKTDFLATFDPSGDDVAAVEVVSVFPSTVGTWCTPEQVEQWTGVGNISAATVALASSMIDTFTGAAPEAPADAISTKDRKHLAKATAWQAVWVAGKPGLISQRENANSISSDTQTITREDRADIMLAPMARREIMNLSWVGTRSVIVPPVSWAQRRRNFLNESSDPAWFGGEGAIP